MAEVNNRKARRSAGKNIGKIAKLPTKDIDPQTELEEMESQLKKMIEDRDAKCKAAKEQLISMLEVTVDKYRTATGTAEALRMLRFVLEDNGFDIKFASELAWDMAVEADRMREKAEKLDFAEMDQLCDGFYEKEFKLDDNHACFVKGYNLAFELMRIDLCRNVGGAAEDMVGFIDRAQAEIDSINEKIDELKAGKEVE